VKIIKGRIISKSQNNRLNEKECVRETKREREREIDRVREKESERERENMFCDHCVGKGNF
jgi:hypothetical protein